MRKRGEGGTNGFKYNGPITLQKTARIVARVFDSGGGIPQTLEILQLARDGVPL